MEEQFRQFLNSYTQLSETEFGLISKIIIKKRLKSGSHLVEANKICNEIAFYNKGYFRYYYYSKTGDEVTSDFYFAPNFATSFTSLITGKPSGVNVQAMEDMDIWAINKTDLNNLYSKCHNIEKLGRLIAESVFVNSEQHLLSLLNKTATERYKDLLYNNPEYIQKIPLQYIASYLGITQETLSRVRKKIHYKP